MNKINSQENLTPVNYKHLPPKQMFSQINIEVNEILSHPLQSKKEVEICLQTFQEWQQASTLKYKAFCLENNTRTFKMCQKFCNRLTKLSVCIANFISFIPPFSSMFNYVREVHSTKIENDKHQLFITGKINCLQEINNSINKLIEFNNEINELIVIPQGNIAEKLGQLEELIKNLYINAHRLDSKVVDVKALLTDLGLNEQVAEALMNASGEIIQQGSHEFFTFIEQLVGKEPTQILFAPDQNLKDAITKLNDEVNKLIADSQHNGPAKLYLFKETTNNLQDCINQLHPGIDRKNFLINLGLNENTIEFLLNASEDLVKLESNEFFTFIEQLAGKEYAQSLFGPTQEILHFDVNPHGGLQISKQLAGQRPVRARPDYLNSYPGTIEVSLRDTKNLKALTELRQFLAANSNCRPKGLILRFGQDQTFNEEILQLVKEIGQTIPYIQIEGLQHLDLASFSPEQEQLFFQLLPRMNLAPLSGLCFSKRVKTWNDDQLNSLKKLTINLLDLRQVPTAELAKIFPAFPAAEHLILNQVNLKDRHLKIFIEQGYFQNLISLDLTGCSGLTTDTLIELMKINNLKDLKCPDIKKGRLPLPELSNPFDIKHFYLSAPITRQQANQLYSGPSLFAPVFQIPLARQNEEYYFSEKQFYLDPNSVTYWLYKNDYKTLQAQPSIRSIIADNCAYLNDDNLSDFLQKFPQATELSLCNCQHVTNKGIIRLLQNENQITKLDLTSCRNVTNALFAERPDGAINLSKLEEVILSDTQITSAQIESLPDELKKKIKFENKTLKITNEELETAGSLQAALALQQPLNNLLHIDLSGCTSLKLEDFQYLMKSLTSELEVYQEGTQVVNPMRLNIYSLNLQGTPRTDLWFQGIHATDFGNLQQIIVSPPPQAQRPVRRQINRGGRNHQPTNTLNRQAMALDDDNRDVIKPANSNLLKERYPEMHFHENYTPVVQTVDINKSLNECLDFLHRIGDDAEIDKKAKKFIYNRIFIELFEGDCENKELLEQVLSHRVNDVNHEELRDLRLDFSDTYGNFSSFPFFREEAYCQSLYLRNELRPGGLFFKAPFPIENQNATPAAAELIYRLMQGESLPPAIHWLVVAKATELAGPKTMHIPALYTQLMELFHQQINEMAPAEAHDMLTAITALEDETASNLFRIRLNDLLPTNPGLREIARNFGMVPDEFGFGGGFERDRGDVIWVEEFGEMTLAEYQANIGGDPAPAPARRVPAPAHVPAPMPAARAPDPAPAPAARAPDASALDEDDLTGWSIEW